LIVELDIRILVQLCALGLMILGGLSLLFSSYHASTSALRPIGASTIVMSLALVLISLQGLLSDLITVVAAHGLMAASMLLIDRGVRVFQRESTWDPVGWSVVGATIAGIGGLLFITSDLRPRLLLLSVSGVILFSRVALRLRRGARSGGTPAHRITANIFWIFAGILLLRIPAVILSPPHLAAAAPDPIQGITLPITMLLLSAATLGFWSMEVQRLHGELMKLATTDEMTGALNRREFLAQCDRHFARHARSGEPLSLVLFDLDHFKRVNDTYGHPAGDEVLRQAVRVLELAVRPGDVVGRFGGEEFALLLPGATANQAAEIAERARETMAAAAFPVGDYRIPVTSSAGVASLPTHGGDLSALIHAADAALYAAKASGRNCVELAAERAYALR